MQPIPHAMMRMTMVCDAQYCDGHERNPRHASAGAAPRHRGAGLPAAAAHGRATATALLEELERRGFATDANTLYPLLRRLEKQEYLTSEWNTDEARPRKFYRTSEAGIRLADTLTDEWRSLTAAIASLTARGELT